MANHVERVHHRAFAINVGKLSEDGTVLTKRPEPLTVKTNLYSEVSYVILDKMGDVVKTATSKGVVEGCDQLQKKLCVKTHNGIVMIDLRRVIAIKQTETVKVNPGCKPGDIPADAEIPEDSTKEDGTDKTEENAGV